jgi:hypothetical protein
MITTRSILADPLWPAKPPSPLHYSPTWSYDLLTHRLSDTADGERRPAMMADPGRGRDPSRQESPGLAFYTGSAVRFAV